MKKRYWVLLFFAAALLLTYLIGPRPPQPVYTDNLPKLPGDLNELEAYIDSTEAQRPVRKDNQARIIWQDGQLQVTEYSIVYLHGFAGSYRDGFPVNKQVADTFGANLYLARWAGHGLKPDVALDRFTAETAWESAKEALVIGQTIGKKVVILSTSTGGTLAIKLAAVFPDAVHGLVNMSPNIKDDEMGAFLLNSPWGYEIASLVSLGEHKKITHQEEIASQYWDTIYPSEALINLQVLIGTTMKPETYEKVTCPVLTLYYYDNMLEEDEHVEVNVYPEVHQAFSTPDAMVKLVALEKPGTHFIGSDIKSSDIQSVKDSIIQFCQHTLGMTLKPPD